METTRPRPKAILTAGMVFTSGVCVGGCGQHIAHAEEVPACEVDLEGGLERLRVPGLSAGVIADGRLVCAGVAGMANIEDARPVVADTAFQWASVSKTVTATAAMILFDEGRFALDDDVGDHLPFPVRNPNCPDAPITFRQLMTHTSSIVDNGPIYDDSYTMGDSPIPLGDFVRSYVVPGGDDYDADRNFAADCPGESSEYSNIAVGLLGHAVEEIAGQPFDEFCRERIFDPLGMTEASFHLANLDVTGIATEYHTRADGSFRAIGHVGYPTFPDGLLRTSVSNMARILAMMAQSGSYDGQRVLAESTANEMRRVQFPALDDTQGLVWYYDFDGTLLGHDGEDCGASSLMFFDPSDGTGALLVGNGIWWDNSEAEALDLFRALLEEAHAG